MKLRNPTIYTPILLLHAVQAGFRHAPSGFGDFSYNCPIGISLHTIWRHTHLDLLAQTLWYGQFGLIAGVTLSLTVPLSTSGYCGKL